MGLFEKIAVIDLKLQLSLIPAAVVFAASVFVGAALIGEEWAFWASVAVGIIFGVTIAVVVYRRLPS